MNATDQDILHLESLYQGRKAYHGELHDHAATGGTSDGKCTLTQWKEGMAALSLDFATIVDHKQVLHMYLPEWDDRIFIGGTEPGTGMKDKSLEKGWMHYNMLFAAPNPLEELLEQFEEYQFTGGWDGHFGYPKFTTERFRQVIATVREKGGFFVHPHPKQCIQSDDPLDYWFADETGLEVIYTFRDTRDGDKTAANYKLWTDLLALGKRVWATAGNDEHSAPSDKALTTIYAEEKSSKCYIRHLRTGDFVCGNVGIRMCVGNTVMGGQCALSGRRLVLSVGDFHKSVLDPSHTYRVDLLSSQGLVCSRDISCTENTYLAVDTEDHAFYRAEVFDTTLNSRIAIGNPIWNK